MKAFSFRKAISLYSGLMDSRTWACFDVFDTLLRRRCHPSAPVHAVVLAVAEAGGIQDVLAVERERWSAFSDLCANSAKAGLDGETTLIDLATEWTRRLGRPNLGALAARAEVEADLVACYANPELHKLTRSLKESGKRVAVISDMYIGGPAVQELLDATGFGGLIDAVFVSGDMRLRKRSGRLFRHVLNDLEIAPEDTAHMGDDAVSDWLRPQNLGIASVLVADSAETYRRARTQIEARSFRKQATTESFFTRFLRDGRRPYSTAGLLAVALAARCGPSQPSGEYASVLMAAQNGLGLSSDGPRIAFEEYPGARTIIGPHAIWPLPHRGAVEAALLAARAPTLEECADAEEIAVIYREARRFGVGIKDMEAVAIAELCRAPLTGSWRHTTLAACIAGARLARYALV